MTLKVWRVRGRILAKCTKCGSQGSAHVPVRVVEDEGRKRAMADHHHRAGVVRTAYAADLNETMRQLHLKTITNQQADDKFRKLGAAHFENMRSILETMPGPGDGVTELVEKCPWCGCEEQVTVAILPDGVEEPPEWLERSAA